MSLVPEEQRVPNFARTHNLFTRKRIRTPFRRRKAPMYRSVSLKQKLDQHMFKIKYDVANLTSDGSGNISLALNANNFSGAGEHASLKALFDEYKVVSCSLNYFPILTSANSNSLLDLAPLYVAKDYDDTTALTTTAEMIHYDNCQMKQLTKPFRYVMRFSSNASKSTLNRAGWNNLDSDQTVGSIKLFSTGLDVSTTYGQYVIEFIVLVRGRR